MRRLWVIPIAGAVLAPLVTWWPMLAFRFPWLGLPAYPAAQGIDLWSAQTFYLAAFGMIAVLVGREDRYLGLAVALAGLTIFFRGAAMDPTHSVMFALGALMLIALRQTPNKYHPKIISILVALGTFELLYVLQQRFLGYDLLWGPLFGGQLLVPCTPELVAAGKQCGPIQPLGTIGTVDGAAAYIAIIAPLMPWWLMLVAIFAVVKSHAVSAILALGAGLVIRFRHNKPVLAVVIAGCMFAAIFAAYAKSNKPLDAHMLGRGAMWQFAVNDWVRTDPIVGFGLGGWSQRIPVKQVTTDYKPTGELWREAHNEYLQWLVELGVIGAMLLAFWLWAHRAMFAHPVYGGSIAALGVNALTFFPMHVVQLSLVALVLVGLATAPIRDPSSFAPEWGQEN